MESALVAAQWLESGTWYRYHFLVEGNLKSEIPMPNSCWTLE